MCTYISILNESIQSLFYAIYLPIVCFFLFMCMSTCIWYRQKVGLGTNFIRILFGWVPLFWFFPRIAHTYIPIANLWYSVNKKNRHALCWGLFNWNTRLMLRPNFNSRLIIWLLFCTLADIKYSFWFNNSIHTVISRVYLSSAIRRVGPLTCNWLYSVSSHL